MRITDICRANCWVHCWANLLAVAIIALVGCAVALASDDPAATKQKLARVRIDIAALGQKIAADLKQRDVLAAHLRDTELAITATLRRIDALRLQRGVAERRRTALRAEQALRHAELVSARGALAGQLRAAYKIGRQEQLKLLLNQAQPARVGRLLAYYGYFGRARAAQIRVIGAAAERLAQLAVAIDAETLKLTELETDNRTQLAALQSARRERGEAITQLSRRVSSGNRALAMLRQQAEALESLLQNLERVVKDFPVDSQAPFAAMQGRLIWPVRGHISTDFGTARGAGLRWNGVTIDADRGAKVRAAYFGRVIYADWLQGLGLLLIVEHNGGFLSLYGHNEVIYKSAGDWVGPGDVISSLADAEGVPAQLYFEIRQGRRPLEPRPWFKPGK
jgi:septal ring factor EnvC (AmiA/AmiB activator)